MEFVFALFIISFITGLMAKSSGRKFWPWFFIGVPLPLIANIILLCLPDKSKKKGTELRAVENNELFDHLFISKDSKQLIDYENYISATT